MSILRTSGQNVDFSVQQKYIQYMLKQMTKILFTISTSVMFKAP